jgi:hypothetical protein
VTHTQKYLLRAVQCKERSMSSPIHFFSRRIELRPNGTPISTARWGVVLGSERTLMPFGYCCESNYKRWGHPGTWTVPTHQPISERFYILKMYWTHETAMTTGSYYTTDYAICGCLCLCWSIALCSQLRLTSLTFLATDEWIQFTQLSFSGDTISNGRNLSLNV